MSGAFKSANQGWAGQFTNPLNVGAGGPNKSTAPLTSALNKMLGIDQKNLTPATPEPQTAIDPPPELAAPTAADPAAQQAAEDALKKAKRNQGRAATILSGTVGEDTSANKILLGA